jgi:ribose transport system substrate-binding protein
VLGRSVMWGIAAVVLVAAAGCGDDEGSGSGASDGGGPEQVRVAMLLPSVSQGASLQEKAGIEAQAEREENADVVLRAGQSDTDFAAYRNMIDDAVSQQFEVVAVNISDPKVILPALEAARRQGVKIVGMAHDIPDFEEETVVATEQRAAARLAGEYMKEQLPDGGKVGIMHCLPGNPVTDDRVAGFMDGLKGAAGVEIVSTLDAQCDRNEGRTVMEDMLTRTPDLDAMYSVSDTQTLGALVAIEAAGKELIVASIDAQDEMVEKLRQGQVGATVDLNFTEIGSRAVAAAVGLARDERVPPKVEVAPKLVTDETAASR